MARTPTIVIIGRPNVGKSTLLNAVIKQRKAIVSDIANTTRDRVYGTYHGQQLDMLMVDTAGLTWEEDGEVAEVARSQALAAVETADLVYFCVDTKSELTSSEYEIAEILRKKLPKQVPVLLVATKAEKPSAQDQAAEYWGLGIGEDLLFISAQQGFGLYQLLQKSEELLLQAGWTPKGKNTKNDEEPADDYTAKIALLGRPNAGKSTLLNTLSRKEVSIVNPMAGTTRDQIDSAVRFENESYLLIDTAGVRRKAQMNKEAIERYSRLRALQALQRSDVAVLLIDATIGVSHMDQLIAGEIREAGVGVIIVFNKWDIAKAEQRELIAEKAAAKAERTGMEIDKEKMEQKISEQNSSLRQRYLRQAQSKLPFIPWAPVLFTSSLTYQGLHHIFTTAKEIMAERQKQIPTNTLNVWLKQVLTEHHHTLKTGKELKAKYIQQVGSNPPHFKVWVNDADATHFSFRRFLENRLRDHFGFWGTPIVIETMQNKGSRR
jgi:GTP-binding protein